MQYAKLIGFSGVLIAATVASAQSSNQYPQPYDSRDPQNYGAPASQAYSQQTQYQQGQPQQGQPVQRYNPDDYPRDDRSQDNPAYSAQDDRNYQNGQEAISQAPPELPAYDQPEAPGDGYLWTPGYWAFGNGGYYWVPGAWVEPPYQGALWTPGYWGYGGSNYLWNAGYWGPTIGYYGGIDYGFGYFGTGFYGGYWNGGNFFYNRACWNGGRGRFFYDQPYRGVGGVHPGGRSFNDDRGRHDEHRGGSYNGRGSEGGRGFKGGRGSDGGHGFAGNRGNPDGDRRFEGHPAHGSPVTTQPYRAGGDSGRGNYTAPSQQPADRRGFGGSSGYSGAGRQAYVGSGNYGGMPISRPQVPVQGYAGGYNHSGTPISIRPVQGYTGGAYGGGTYTRPAAPSGGSFRTAPIYRGGGSGGSFNGGGRMSAPSGGGGGFSGGGFGGGGHVSAPGGGGGGGTHGGGHR